MGEKSGGLTNMIITIVALIALILVIQIAFPELTEQVVDGFKGIVSDSMDSFEFADPTN